MSRQIKGMLYFFVTDFRYSITIFWTILTAITIVSIIASYLMLRIDGSMFLAISFAVYIYGAIFGFIAVRESLSFSLKMGGTRKNYFVSIGILFLGLSVVLAFLENVFHSVIIAINKSVGITNFNLIHLAEAIDKGDSWFTRFSIDVCMLFFMLAAMFVLGLIFHRCGQVGGLGIVGLLAIAILIFAGTGTLGDFVKPLFFNTKFIYYVAFFGIGVIFYLLSGLLLRNISAKSAREC